MKKEIASRQVILLHNSMFELVDVMEQDPVLYSF